MAQEVDQASVDVIKTLLESENSKRFFVEYLRSNFTIAVQQYNSEIVVDLLFNNMIIQKVRYTSNISSHSF